MSSIRILAVTAVVALVGVAAYFAGLRSGEQKAPPGTPPVTQEQGTQSDRIELSGSVQTANPAEILPDTSGVVQSLHVRKGDTVKEGDLLAIVRNEAFEAIEQRLSREYQSLVTRVETMEKNVATAKVEAARMQSDLESASSKLREARQDAERLRLLHAEGAVARQKFEQSQADLQTSERQYKALEQVLATSRSQLELQEQSLASDRAAKADKLAEWEAAKGDVSLGEVLAPVEGVVTEIRVTEGQQVGPNAEPMMEIAPVDAVRYAVVQPSEAQMRRIRVGQPATLQPQALSDVRELPGTVFGFRGSEVLVEFLDENNRIPPGSTVKVVIETVGEEIAQVPHPDRSALSL